MTDMADYKQLCAELLDWTRLLIEIPDPPVTRCADDLRDLLARAHAALAEPEPEGPTDEELLELSQYHSVSYTMSDGKVVYPLQQGSDMRDDVLSFARVVLARWGSNTSRIN